MATLPTTAAAGPRPEDERLPLGATVGYGVQHILAMFGGIIAVPVILGGVAGLDGAGVGKLLASCLFISGVATLLQTLGLPFFGSQLPLVQGISFASVSTLITIILGNGGGEVGLRTAFGSTIVAALVGVAVSPFFSQVVQFFPPVVTGSIITVIGLSLFPVAGGWIAGQATLDGTANPDFANTGDIYLALFTLLVVLVLAKIPLLSRLAILLGLVVGTVVALVTGQASFGTDGASWFAVPTPFSFGGPRLAVGPVVSMVVVMLVIMVETTADILAVGEIVGTRVTSRRVGDGLRADMGMSAIAPVLGAFPATAFAQNVGLVALTGIKSRFAVAVGGAMLAVLGLSPALASLVNVIPLPVLGGAGIVLFGSVAASGIRTLGKVSYDSNNNMVVVAVAVGLGLLPSLVSGFWGRFPAGVQTVLGSGISSAAIAAVVLNVFFNMLLPGTPEEPTDVAAAPATMVTPEEIETFKAGGTFPPDGEHGVLAGGTIPEQPSKVAEGSARE